MTVLMADLCLNVKSPGPTSTSPAFANFMGVCGVVTNADNHCQHQMPPYSVNDFSVRDVTVYSP